MKSNQCFTIYKATRYVAVFILSFMGFLAMAQPVNNLVKDIVMPPPNVASLGKYGEIPVSYFTGVPNISVPITSVQDGTLSASVSLSYHAAGIKVAETASWVGLNWSLNAGGMISRTIQGIADDSNQGYYHKGFEVNPSTDGNLRVEASNGQADMEPDIFNFNVGGISGKFYIDKDHICQFIPKQDFKLEIDGTLPFQGFTIISSDGTRYVFGKVIVNGVQREARDLSRSDGESLANATTWYLLRIETYDKKSAIDFYYDNEFYSYKSPATCKIQATNGGGCSGNLPTEVCSPFGDDYSHRHIITNIEGKRLRKIVSPTNTVEFIANTDRQDLEANIYSGSSSKKALDTIKTYTLLSNGTINPDYCSNFAFSYDYYVDPNKPNYPEGKRLRLNSVQKLACYGGITEPPYEFTYESGTIPYRLSKQVDHWGYYNGQTANEGNLINAPPTTIGNLNYGSSNRDPNEIKAKIGVLNQIKYPTGGKTIFSFESNVVNSNVTVETVKLDIKTCTSTITQCCGTKTNTSATISFTAAELLDTKVILNLTRIPPGTTCSNAYSPRVMVTAYSASTNSSVWYQETNIGQNQPSGSVTFPLNLQAGSYYFVVTSIDGYGSLTILSKTTVNGNALSGGLRIKEIRSNDGVSTANDMVKTYSYTDENSGFSSGRLLIPIKYAYQTPNTNIISGENYLLMTGFGNSNHLGYERVKETLSGNGINTLTSGYSVYKYNVSNIVSYLCSSPVDQYGGAYPAQPTTNNPHLGEMKESYQYADNNQVISSTINTPFTTCAFILTGTSAGYMCKVAPDGGCGGVNITGFNTYYSIKHTLPYRLESVQSMKDGVSSTVTYAYDSQNLILAPTATTMTNSDGKTTVNNTKYITHSDYSASAEAIKMRLLNIIANPMEVTSVVGGITVNGSKTEFSAFNSTGLPTTDTTNNYPYPYKFFKYKITWNQTGTIQVNPNNGGWDLEGIITKYDPAKFKPEKINLRGWEHATETDATEKYTWDVATGLIKTRQFKSFIWTYDYFTNTPLVQKITNIDGQFTTFTYDKFRRVTKATARNGAVVTDYQYNYRDAAQADKNWVETKTTFSAVIGGLLSNNTTFKTARQYFDGLGRPIQSVALANSPNLKDVISVVEYDNQGREFKKYDPFESTFAPGAYVSPLPANLPYTTLEYEKSPLSRIEKVTPPNNWLPTITTYSANIGSEAADAFLYIYPANQIYKTTVKDPDNRVSVSYTDKKGRKIGSRQYKVDGSNNIISEQVFTLNGYDDKDRLSKVFTPRNPNFAELNATELDFSYLYDWDDNVTSKKVPDATAMTFGYNTRNQLVLSQDGNQLALARYLATQYDLYGRPVKTGFATSTSLTNGNPDITLPNTLTETEYSAATSGLELGKVKRTINRFGTYLETFLEYNDVYGRMTAAYGNNHLYSPGGAISNNNFSEKITTTYDLADNVLSKTRIHKPNAATTRTITETMDYDNGLRLKQNKHKVDNEAEQTLSYLDYTVKNQVQTKRMGQVNGLAFLQKVDYQYNALGWLTGINTPTLNGSTNAVCALPFANATGTLDENDLFSLDMRYEAPTAAYTPTGTTATPQYGGNISQMVWQVRGKQKQVYTFQYDHLSRLTEANYSELNASNVKIDDANKYMEKLTYDARGNIKTLQRNGMIGSCTFGLIDNLSYFYNNNDTELADFAPKNRLRKVVESSLTTKGFKRQGTGGDYTYDANGNLKSDPNKGITLIEYNHLNLPTKVTFNTGSTIEWLYDAGGRKLRKTATAAPATITVNGQPIAPGTYISTGLLTSTGTVSAGTTVTLKGKLGVEMLPNFDAQAGSNFEAVQDATIVGDIHDYADGIEYHNGVFEAIYHAEGRVTTINGALKYEYALKDHLGNTRLLFSDKDNNGVITQATNQEASEVTQEQHFYAFGMAMEGTWGNTLSVTDNKYQFGGKELNSDFGLDWMDYGARFYDAAVGRWHAVDPLATKYLQWSPYHFSGNNPVRMIDFDGREWADPKSKKKAEEIDKAIETRLGSIDKDITKINGRIGAIQAEIKEKGTSKKLEKKLANEQSDLKNQQSKKDNLTNARQEIKEMGETTKEKFRFNTVSGSVGLTYRNEKNEVQMDITSTTNAVHEMVHGYQILSGKIQAKGGKEGNFFVGGYEGQINNEVESYKRQFSFDTSGFPSAYGKGSAQSLDDITPDYVRRINLNGDFLYKPPGITNEQVKSVYDNGN